MAHICMLYGYTQSISGHLCPWAVLFLLLRLEYIVCWCIVMSISRHLCPQAVVFLLWKLEFIVYWCIILFISGYICPELLYFFCAVFASKGYPFKNIFDFTTAGDWDCVSAVEGLPALHYSVYFIFLSFGIMSFIVEL